MSGKFDQVVSEHQRLKQEQKELKNDWEKADAVYKEKLKKIEDALLRRLMKEGQQSVRTESGLTVYRTPTGSDWDAFYNWVKEENAFEALEKRIKVTFITDYMKTNKGQLPPGVSVYTEYTARIRKS
jgi:hypothetical protein